MTELETLSLRIPKRITLSSLYRIAKNFLERKEQINKLHKSLRILLEKTLRYLSKRDLEGGEKAFAKKLIDIFLQHFKLKEALDFLRNRNMSLNENSLRWAYGVLGYKISDNMATFLVKHLAEVYKPQAPYGRPDIAYKVYPGIFPTGSPLLSVYIEVKSGLMDNVKKSKDQLQRYSNENPLIICWIGRGEPEDLEDFIESTFNNRESIDYIYIPESLMEPISYIKSPYEVCENIFNMIGIKEDIAEKLRTSFRKFIILRELREKKTTN